MSNEISNELAQEIRTPIEVLLGMAGDGMVSAKKLYEFLELDPSHYARWCKTYILENKSVTEGFDWYIDETPMVEGFRQSGENFGGRPSADYILTSEFAKELCMSARNDKGRQARDYFLKTEKALVVTVKDFNAFKKLVTEQYNALQVKQEEVLKQTNSRLALLEEKSEIMLTHETEWAMDMMEKIEKIQETYGNVKREKITDLIVDRAIEYLGEPYKNYAADYALHHNGKKGKKILVMARDEDTRSAIEQAIKDFEIERGIFEQNEGQKYLEAVLASMGETIIPDPPVPQHIMTDAELESQWADMDKMYGEGWDKQPDIPSEEELYGG